MVVQQKDRHNAVIHPLTSIPKNALVLYYDSVLLPQQSHSNRMLIKQA